MADKEIKQVSLDVMVGVYEDGQTTSFGATLLNKMNDQKTNDMIKNMKWKEGCARIVYLSSKAHQQQDSIKISLDNVNRLILVGIGSKTFKTDDSFNMLKSQFESLQGEQDVTSFHRRHFLEKGIRAGIPLLKTDVGEESSVLLVEDFDGNAKFAAEISEIEIAEFCKKSIVDNDDIFKVIDMKVTTKSASLLLDTNKETEQQFQQGQICGRSMNIAKSISELPANLMTPTIFAKYMQKLFNGVENVKVEIRDKKWAEEMKMNSFLGVSKGSVEEPKICEVTYTGNKDSDEIDLMLVGKGITFDAGGISIKPSLNMHYMKGDMGGSTSCVSSLYGIALLKLPINVKSITFMCENMPSAAAVKPGDVLVPMKPDTTIEVQNTDAEGRLILADALWYASQMKPKKMIDMATLTGAMVIALGHHATGVFSSSIDMWKRLEKAGSNTHDYMWRMPIYPELHLEQMKSNVATINNIGGRAAGSSTAAVFLSQFVDFSKVKEWCHLDIAGAHMGSDGIMTGRPVRTIIEFANNLTN